MFYVSKAIKNKEFLHSKQFSILCNSKKQAEKLAEHLNKNNENSIDSWKLKDNEIWFVYEDGDWYKEYIPFKLKSTKGKISVVANV